MDFAKDFCMLYALPLCRSFPDRERRGPTEKSGHTGTIRKHKQEGCRGLSEGSLWYSCRQDNRISCTWQVYVSPLVTLWMRLFGWTGRLRGLDRDIAKGQSRHPVFAEEDIIGLPGHLFQIGDWPANRSSQTTGWSNSNAIELPVASV